MLLPPHSHPTYHSDIMASYSDLDQTHIFDIIHIEEYTSHPEDGVLGLEVRVATCLVGVSFYLFDRMPTRDEDISSTTYLSAPQGPSL